MQANGAWEDRLAQSEQERVLVWKGRKAAFAAAGPAVAGLHRAGWSDPRAPNFPWCWKRLQKWLQPTGLRVSNVFHAGPTATCIPWCCMTGPSRAQEEIAIDLSIPQSLHLCVDHGGSITGEHGVGRRSSRPWGTLLRGPTLTPCNGCAAASTRKNISNPISSSLAPGYGGEKTAVYPVTHWRQQASQRFF